MKFNSQIISAGSGSIGGCTYSRNHAGQYIRRRAMPVNPGSSFSQIMTGLLGALAARWVSVLTQVQRDGWDAWAAATPHPTDGLGNPGSWTGLNAYASLNSFRQQNTFAVVDGAPALNANTSLNPAVMGIVNAIQSAQNFDFTFDNADEWAGEVDGLLGIYISRPQNASINYFKGPYRLAATVLGAVVPPTSPVNNIPVPFPIVAGQKLFFQARAATADGRISNLVRGFNTVAA